MPRASTQSDEQFKAQGSKRSSMKRKSSEIASEAKPHEGGTSDHGPKLPPRTTRSKRPAARTVQPPVHQQASPEGKSHAIHEKEFGSATPKRSTRGAKQGANGRNQSRKIQAQQSGAEIPESSGFGAGEPVDSDDEAPEEVTHATAQQQAVLQAETELDEQKRARAARQRKRAKVVEKEQESALPVAKETQHRDVQSDEAGDRPQDPEDGPEEDETEEDYLPESVIKAIQANKKDSGNFQPSHPPASDPLYYLSDDNFDEAEDLDPQSLPQGRIVKVLKKTSAFKPSASAKAYLQNKLQGARIRRSREMLDIQRPPPKTQRQKFARKGLLI